MGGSSESVQVPVPWPGSNCASPKRGERVVAVATPVFYRLTITPCRSARYITQKLGKIAETSPCPTTLATSKRSLSLVFSSKKRWLAAMDRGSKPQLCWVSGAPNDFGQRGTTGEPRPNEVAAMAERSPLDQRLRRESAGRSQHCQLNQPGATEAALQRARLATRQTAFAVFSL